MKICQANNHAFIAVTVFDKTALCIFNKNKVFFDEYVNCVVSCFFAIIGYIYILYNKTIL